MKPFTMNYTLDSAHPRCAEAHALCYGARAWAGFGRPIARHVGDRGVMGAVMLTLQYFILLPPLPFLQARRAAGTAGLTTVSGGENTLKSQYLK